MLFFIEGENTSFPNPDFADDDGLLAVGGDLSVPRLISAYTNGIFPWYTVDGVPFWYSPDPRFVLFPPNLTVSKSMRQLFKKNAFTVTADTCFAEVIRNCAVVERRGDAGTWITGDFIDAYIKLHKEGIAHSVEVWSGDRLVGGLYGVAYGRVFTGESMFTHVSNASKYGFIKMVQLLSTHGFQLIDCQDYSDHLRSMGATDIPRSQFLQIIHANNQEEFTAVNWEKLFAG
ncbi:MAG: leucyl/phenylalanyl-tRNA--protein transferase [Chitinophagales bacterium]